MHDRGFRALVIDCDGTLAGYATLGRSRAPGAAGRAARSTSSTSGPSARAAASAGGCSARPAASCARHGLDRLTVWALADNSIACRFYRAMGGVECGRAQDRFCGVPLAKIGFAWPWPGLQLPPRPGQQSWCGYCSPAGSSSAAAARRQPFALPRINSPAPPHGMPRQSASPA